MENCKFIAICAIALIALGFCLAMFSDNKETTAQKITQNSNVQTASSTATKDAKASGNVSIGNLNALASAKAYLALTGFSYSGLIQQLEQGEGYSHAEAEYAAKNCGADWNEQAAKKAKEYLDMSSFSRKGLIQQLMQGDGFTRQQAEYGVKQSYK